MEFNPLFNNFTSGEVSPYLYDRIDLDQYYNAAKTIENFVVLPYGGLLRTPGTYFVAETKDSSKKSVSIPFSFNVTQTYTLEFGDQYIRFFKDDGYITETGVNISGATQANPVVVTATAHGYSNGDEVYISGVVGMTELNGKRFIVANKTTNTFELSGIDGTGYTAYSSGGKSERIYEIASPYLEADLSTLQYAQNADVMWITHPTYKTKKLTRTGHTSWTLSDYTPTADPFTAVDNYPACATFHEQRLWFGYTNTNPQKIWATKSGNFEDMTTGAGDDDALSYTLGTNEVNAIRWLSAKDVLSIGTSGGVLTMGSSAATTPITPTNVMVHMATTEGCYPVMPILVGSELFYLHRDQKRMMGFSYDYNSDSYKSIEMSILSEHITGAGLVSLAYQQSPYNFVWGVRKDGEMIVFTRNSSQIINAWARRTSTGVVESISAISKGTGEEDELWMIVKRTINGATVRYVEYLKPFSFDTISDAYFVNCGLTYSGSAVTTISGLDHLEGEVVSVLADGAGHPNCTVSGGSISLNWSAKKVQVGLGYDSIVELLDLDIKNRFQPVFGRKRRIFQAILSFYETVGGKIGVGSSLDEILFRDSSMAMDEAVPLFSGLKELNLPTGQSRSVYIKVKQDQPLPMCVRGIGLSANVDNK